MKIKFHNKKLVSVIVLLYLECYATVKVMITLGSADPDTALRALRGQRWPVSLQPSESLLTPAPSTLSISAL